jgi:hypothetical protein
MKRSTKIAIAVVAVVVAIPLVLLLAAEVIVNSTAVKPEIEKIIGEILEMDLMTLISAAVGSRSLKTGKSLSRTLSNFSNPSHSAAD